MIDHLINYLEPNLLMLLGKGLMLLGVIVLSIPLWP